MWFGFMSHMISTNLPSNWSLANFSSGLTEFKYDSGASNITTSGPSYTSTTKVVIIASRDIVGDEASSLGIYPFYVLTPSHVCPLILLHCFSFMRFTDRGDFLLCSGVSHRWGLPGNYPVFVMVMVICHYIDTIK